MAEQTVSVVFAPVLSSSSKVIEVSAVVASPAPHPTCLTINMHLQVTNDFVKALEGGERLVLKGTATEEAVLCMSNKTFALKRVEQSNAGSFRTAHSVSFRAPLPVLSCSILVQCT